MSLTLPKVAVVIVTFYPDLTLKNTLHTLYSQNLLICIVDNTPAGSPIFNDPDIRKNISQLIQPKENIGLAKAQNIGIKASKDLKCDFVSFFDQDSQIPDYFKESMLKCHAQIQDTQNLGLIGSNYFDFRTKRYGKFTTLKKILFSSIRYPKPIGRQKVSFVLSTGSFFPISIFDKVGTFREDFFIDHIDTEYCMRLNKNGYNIYLNTDCTLKHTIGKRNAHRFLNLFSLKPNHHNEFRKYTTFKNGTYMIKLYISSVSFTNLILARLVHDILGIILYEEHKVVKLWFSTKGIILGLFKKKTIPTSTVTEN